MSGARRIVAILAAGSMLNVTVLRAGVLCDVAIRSRTTNNALVLATPQPDHSGHLAHARHVAAAGPATSAHEQAPTAAREMVAPGDTSTPAVPPGPHPADHGAPGNCASMFACAMVATLPASADVTSPAVAPTQPAARNAAQPTSVRRSPEPPPPRG